MIQFTERDNHVTFQILVQPRAGRSRVIGEINGALKIKIAAPPVDGEANEECQRFLAQVLDVRRADIEIVSGMTSRKKAIRVWGLNGTNLTERIARYLQTVLRTE